jgi:hypothetical protein
MATTLSLACLQLSLIGLSCCCLQCCGAVTAGLFHSWQSCLKASETKQHQQQLSAQFMSQVAFVWSRMFSLWHDIAPSVVSKVAPLLLRCAVPALQLADLCLQQVAALPPGDSTIIIIIISSSSSGKPMQNDDYRAALLLQPAVLRSLVMISQWAADNPRVASAAVASLDAAVETAALQQLTGACALLQRHMHRSAAQLQGAAAASSSSLPTGSSSRMGNRASSSSSSSNDAPGNGRTAQQHPATRSVPAFHDNLLYLLPGGLAYVDAMEAAAADAANTSAVNGVDATASVLEVWASAAAMPMVDKQIQRCNMVMHADHPNRTMLTAIGEILAAAPVAQTSTEYLQLSVQLQLLAAALLQQQQQRGDAPNNDLQHSPWMILLRCNSIRLRRYIRAVTRMTAKEDCSGIRQLLAGPDAPLLRALAAPLHVAELWQYEDEQQLLKDVGSPAELLYALVACIRAQDGGNGPDAGEDGCCSRCCCAPVFATCRQFICKDVGKRTRTKKRRKTRTYYTRIFGFRPKTGI